ncbi:unnamed protein product [Ranitomeya imitator]|uniref:DiGeorge syndrome critical region 6 n=1 Tax=Ranitomeya imitator TaxID=111125 RepID=A0ABN9KY08_9NEOB|nr:unnamed protein product [Ranitomeya imitator]
MREALRNQREHKQDVGEKQRLSHDLIFFQAGSCSTMAGYLGTYGEPSDITQQQEERHYYLLSELQSLVKDLPSSFQQRLSYTTLSDLALALIDGTVFEIVQGLLEIQHLTEKNLYNQRIKLHAEHRVLKQDLLKKHKEAQQSCKAHNMSVLQSTQQRELEVSTVLSTRDVR